MKYFEQLTNLLNLEKQEDKNQFVQLSKNTSIHERRLNGICWYPIVIKDSEPIKGDYIIVEMERVSFREINHQFRFGMSVTLFSNVDYQQYKMQGSVTHVNRDTIKIKFKTDELPEWTREGKLGIDCLFDENSYNEMEFALKQAEKNYIENQHDISHILLGENKATFNEDTEVKLNKALNSHQQEAVIKIVQANELCILHGPPGTGKTTTLVESIKQMIQAGAKKILVTAPSNIAVDVLCEKIYEQGIEVVRIGNPVKVTEKLLMLTLDYKILQHASIKEIKKLKKQAQEFKNMAHKYKRNFGKAERDQRKLLFEEAYKIMKSVEDTENYISKDILSKCQVIGATLVGCNHYSIQQVKYDAICIDEAGQALEPACWIPILKSQKIILAGDHCQLPPTIKSYEAASKGLNETLFEKCIKLQPQAVVLLQEQYRMHEKIMQFSSTMFYNNKLIAHLKNKNHVLFEGDIPSEFIDTAGCGFDEKVEGTTISNAEEANMVLKHLKLCLQNFDTHQQKYFPSIAIISPYKQQIITLQEMVQADDVLNKWTKNISINTIDSFQGQEKDIVYISMTRSNAKNEIGFLKDTRRMNVAMTRARKKLVVVGDSATLSKFSFYEKYIEYTQAIHGYSSAWSLLAE